MTGPTRQPGATATGVQVIAHRGASRRERENTVAAFRAAVDLGAHAIELDVRRTADGALVVHHDALLADGLALIDVQRAQLPEHIPGLAEALDACRGAWVNVEIKNDPGEPDFDPDDAVAAGVVAEVARRPGEGWLISSFRLATIDRVHQLDPELPTAWLVDTLDDGLPALAAAHGHVAVHPWVGSLDAAGIRRSHAHGLAVNTWTCDDPVRMAELARWGIDGICTNIPEVALAVVG